MTVKKSGLFVVLIFVLMACNQKQNAKHKSRNELEADAVYQPAYANRFSIQYFKDHKKIEVKHPWDESEKPMVTLLSDDEQFLKDHPSAIKIPVEKWISVTSTQICYANELNVIDQLVGMAEPEYVSNPKIQEGLKKGNIRNIGTAFAPDLELLLALNPDMMMISPFKEDFYGPARSAGINIATNSSYLENTPLGRVEWLVYVAAFFNKEEEAISKVTEIAQRYHKVKALAASSKIRPSVFLGKVYQGVWYTAAAESYNANFLRDAGVDYVFKDRHGTGSLSYDFETVYEAAGNCDYWSLMVNYKDEFSYSALLDEDGRYADFKAFKTKNVIFSNTNHSMLYEKGLLEPDVVLSDLVMLFHPGLLKGKELVYYKKLYKD
ncbi:MULTISPECIES: ABC transporter substrate-binding protein [unclassified Saccharicrinis]|uniref:ABC transporter substrate-binding protein n=1 Tax=unclassified Saccharicrinis TaxID=2646859 RepID=UPI003D3558D5